MKQIIIGLALMGMLGGCAMSPSERYADNIINGMSKEDAQFMYTQDVANAAIQQQNWANAMMYMGNSMQQMGAQQQYQYQAPSAPAGPSAYDTFQKWNPPSTRQNCLTTYHPIGKTADTVCQ